MEDQKLFIVEEKPLYEIPQVITYTDEEILEELGPAQANTYGCINTTGLVGGC